MNIIEVDNLDIEELTPYREFTERQLLKINEPDKIGMFIAESPNVIRRAFNNGYDIVSLLIESSLLKGDVIDLIEEIDRKNTSSIGMSCEGIPLKNNCHSKINCYILCKDEFNKLLGYEMTRGVLALVKRKALQDMEVLINDKTKICVLEDIMNPTNLGAIFRSAAALGIEAVLLTKGCTDPLYKRSARVSMGTVFQVPWTYVDTHWHYKLKKLGFKTIATALRDDAIAISDDRLKGIHKKAIILGTEGTGLREDTISESDYKVVIPMHSEVDSLNVAAASAVVFWELSKNTHG